VCEGTLDMRKKQFDVKIAYCARKNP